MSNSLRDLILKNIEDTRIPEAALAYWTANKGGEWTKRREKALLEAVQRVAPEEKQFRFLTLGYRGIVLDWGNYYMSDEKTGGELVLCREMLNGGVDRQMDPEKLREWNVSRYRGAEERNAQRHAALLDKELMQTAQGYLGAHAQIREALADVTAKLEGLMEHGKPLSADSYAIRKELMGEK